MSGPARRVPPPPNDHYPGPAMNTKRLMTRDEFAQLEHLVTQLVYTAVKTPNCPCLLELQYRSAKWKRHLGQAAVFRLQELVIAACAASGGVLGKTDRAIRALNKLREFGEQHVARKPIDEASQVRYTGDIMTFFGARSWLAAGAGQLVGVAGAVPVHRSPDWQRR